MEVLIFFLFLFVAFLLWKTYSIENTLDKVLFERGIQALTIKTLIDVMEEMHKEIKSKKPKSKVEKKGVTKKAKKTK